MKRLLLSTAILICLFAACKKSNQNNSPQAGVYAKLNGKLVNFSAQIRVDTTYGEIAIMASPDSNAVFPFLNIVILPANGKTTPGLYPSQNLTPLENSSILSLTTSGVGIGANSGFVSADDSLTVTSVSSTGVSGTFYGHMEDRYQDPQTNAIVDSIITVTGGTFNVKF